MDSSRPSDLQPLCLSNPSAPCRGGSMQGTLLDGDCLWISRVSFASLQAGDVVAFHSGGKVVAHRIVGRDESGFLTQGDGNLRRDSVPLTPDCLIGKVAERERGGSRSAVAGGARGRRWAAVLHAACRVRYLAGFLSNALYRMIRASRLVSWVWRPRIMTVHFASRNGRITKFIHQGRTVAYWIPHEEQWMCQKPYDLLLSAPPR
jgi:signal peptidase I